MEFLWQYLLFVGKAVTIVLAIIFVVGAIINAAREAKNQSTDDRIDIKPLNDRYDAMAQAFRNQLLDKFQLKAWHKAEKQKAKDEAKANKEKAKAAGSAEEQVEAAEEVTEKRYFVLDFDGDIRASRVEALREEITALLTTATEHDEVVVRLESPGGMVHAYGLAASQLQRIRDRGIKLTVTVDKVAASGGYLMAVVADHIIAAPFAAIGSIGVVLQMPNFNKLLKKHDIEYEQLTAGEYKRTLSVFGENTKDGRKKMQEELEITHRIFKDFIGKYRPEVDLKKVATGEHWHAIEALDMRLVDEIQTSDDYLMAAAENHKLYQVEFHVKKSLQEKLSSAMQAAADKLMK